MNLEKILPIENRLILKIMKANKYLFDTNIITYLEERDHHFHQSVKQRLSLLPDESQIYISLLTLFEIDYGIEMAKEQKVKELFIKFKQSAKNNFLVLNLSDADSPVFGALKAQFKNKTGIGKAISKHNIDFMFMRYLEFVTKY